MSLLHTLAHDCQVALQPFWPNDCHHCPSSSAVLQLVAHALISLTCVLQVSGVMRGLIRNIPTYKWLLVLPQLTSRIYHPQQDVQEFMQTLLGAIVDHFPQQALWAMAMVTKSTVRQRQVRPVAAAQHLWCCSAVSHTQLGWTWELPCAHAPMCRQMEAWLAATSYRLCFACL